MIYFSELKGKKVYTEDQVYIGWLEDIVFLANDNPKVTKIVIRDTNKEKLYIPSEQIKKINHTVIIQKNYTNEKIVENELFVLKNLLDKQIIDIKGSKVVRVNDVAIQDKPSPYIAGVDIGVVGILRWFGFGDIVLKFLTFLGLRFTSRYLSWGDIQPLELSRGRVVLKKEEEKLERIRPEDLADYLEKTNVKNVGRILKMLDEKSGAEVIQNLNINYQTAVFNQFATDKAAKIISLIDPDEAVDILLSSPRKRREEILNILDPKKRKEIEYLLRLSKTPIGDILTSEFLTVHPEDTAAGVIEKIRKEASDFSYLFNIYVINKNDQLIGVFNLHELLLQKPETLVYKFMIQNVLVIHLTIPKEIVLRKMIKYSLTILPVIDQDKHILGTVFIGDYLDQLFFKS